MKIVLASENEGKIREFAALLAPMKIEVVPQKSFGVTSMPETAKTFVENAIQKARHASAMTNLPAIGDDSGLAVDALQGNPGIYSARYAGEDASARDNINKLLHALKDVPAEKRQAFFYCVLVFVKSADDPTPIICEGKWHGMILDQIKGDRGFGYDPVFYLPDRQKTAAELPLEIKNKISHRGIALQLLLNKLSDQA